MKLLPEPVINQCYSGLTRLMDNSATIAAAAGAVGVVTTAVLSSKAAVKDASIDKSEMSNIEKTAHYAKTYGGAVLSGAATIGCIALSDRIHVKKEAALGAGLIMWQSKYEALRHGTDKLRAVKNAHHLKDTQNDSDERTKKIDEMLNVSDEFNIYEPYTEQIIYGVTKAKLTYAELKLNECLAKTGETTLNFALHLLGGKTCEDGEHYVWSFDSEFQDYAWSYYGGAWITFEIGLRKVGDIDMLDLYYEVEPDWFDKDEV